MTDEPEIQVMYGDLTAREHAIVFAHIWQLRHPQNTTAYQAIVGLLGLLPFEELGAAIQKAPQATALRTDMENHDRQFPDGQPPRWQPIESAPKDGSPLLLVSDERMRVCNWTISGWAFYQRKPGAPIAVMLHPTHWQPLPASPPNTL